jgi:choline dehydrogenase-like flavoprotein
MLTYADTFPDGSRLTYDVCVIGSGPAAFAVALSLDRRHRGRPLRVVMLESGDRRLGSPPTNLLERAYDSHAQALYAGEVTGWLATHRPDYLTASRLRHYGGTSNVWSGWCWPLEPQDLLARGLGQEEVSWPIPYDELDRYYRRAQSFLRLGAFAYEDAGYWVRALWPLELAPIATGAAPLRTRVIQFRRLNVVHAYGRVVETSPVIDAINNANVVGFETVRLSDGKHVVTGAIVRTIEGGRAGRTLRVSAGVFVLAAGAIESTRLLLLSDIGNTSGHLGRHLIEHPYLWTAATFRLKGMPEGVRNFYFAPEPIRLPGGVGVLAALVPRSGFLRQQSIGTFRILLGGAPDIPGTLNIHWEQVPDPYSRIALSAVTPPDCFGLPRSAVHLESGEADKRTAKACIQAGLDVLCRADLITDMNTPDLAKDPWEWREPHRIVPGNHAMGTTRMSVDPSLGVVDPACRVHDSTNLFVASASTFPTGGYANPTMTVVALALRIADHLSGSWAGGAACST